MPPVLITNWCRNIAKVTDQSVVAYSEYASGKRKLDLSARFIVVPGSRFSRTITGIPLQTTSHTSVCSLWLTRPRC